MPPGWLPLFEAYKLVGRDLFPDEWLDGQELAAPSDEEIAANKDRAAEREFRAAEKRKHLEWAKRASVGVRTGSPAPRVRTARPRPPAAPYRGQPFPLDVIADDERRREARKRGDEAWDRLRQWLYTGTVLAKCPDDHGHLCDIPKNLWALPNAMTTFFTGEVSHGGVDRPVFVLRADLEAAIRGEPRPDQAAAQDESALDDGETELIVYTPPFVNFMHRASQELGLDANTKITKEKIENWLRENWQEDLGQISNRKIEQMATFIRQPEDQKGGHFKPRRDN